ncbi:hypothetical protein M948_18140 [Virgibacillus sp. CM-4]|uniref:hypothetical protein n=1 Tax=Virgibacillus sp. CM-4 TaxID=1354277 RepID=UPI0003884B3A|nr:hypothetical protein [Virgibacillus sp. CM-4]EQB35026.1 hypothetical protein M948_18140 [Virgibacillus sp. CM-4]
MKTIEKQQVIDVLNGLEVIEENGGEDTYVLVENSEENHKQLNSVGISSETINRYGDEETFCILALAFSEGYADLYDGNKIIFFDEKVELEVEEGKTIIFYKDDGDFYLAVSEDSGNVSINKLTDEHLQALKNLLHRVN